MKKFYSYLLSALMCLGFNLSLSAQTTIAEGLITLSDDVNAVWYYIGNGHSGDNAAKPVNDSDGRFCSM
ncbi:hypothetical protein LJB92_01510 [Bacteroidales bacterium OttesenSCG-928-M06]|nr:hypothetical protein [Bacteroidales bacterium OttesenSCG-928-M06]